MGNHYFFTNTRLDELMVAAAIPDTYQNAFRFAPSSSSVSRASGDKIYRKQTALQSIVLYHQSQSIRIGSLSVGKSMVVAFCCIVDHICLRTRSRKRLLVLMAQRSHNRKSPLTTLEAHNQFRIFVVHATLGRMAVTAVGITS